MLEFEKKIMLHEDEYNALDSHIFSDANLIKQTNYYYDNNAFEMNKSGITVRIREIDGVYLTLMKDHSKKDSDCSVETYYNLDYEYNDIFLRKMGLCCHGKLHTERKMLVYDNVKVFLDKNSYLDIVDYELEVEYRFGFENDAFDSINKTISVLIHHDIIKTSEVILSRIGIGKSKSARFFERKAFLVKEV